MRLMMDSPLDLNALSLFAQVSEVQEALPIPDDVVSALLSLGKAILILIIGLIFANIFKGFVRKSLHKTDMDNRLAAFVMGENAEDAKKIQTEKWISEIVGWIIILFVVVAFLNALELDLVSEPLNALLNEVMSFLPNLGGAAIILAVAWLLATVVKLIVIKALSQFNFDEKLNQQVQEDEETMEESAGDEIAIGDTIGNTLFWFIILLFLPSILGILGLDGTLRPLEELVNDILGVVPNVFAALIIAFIGWIIAQVVKKVVTNLLQASGANAIGAKFGMSTTNKKQSLSYVIGSVVYVLILIPIAITALDALQIQAISVPAIAMLDQVLDILPKLFAAIVILGFAYFGAQYLAELLVNLLTNIGFNNVFVWLGITESVPVVEDTGEVENTSDTKTPAQIVGIILVIAIMLVATITAVDILQIEALKEVVAFISLLAGQVLIGVIIFGVGLYFANLVFRLIVNSGTQQAQFLAQVARIAIIVLVAAMALERIGIAPNIVNLAFGLLTGGIAVAIALAFGLGGREAAGNALQRWLDSFTNGGGSDS
ncbi:Conserved TM helix repeat-containing protein [Cyanobacterium stanieri PCC 7202]|uniref:Conserved TM helix repeat-containing protein n=1 Tax=Cyanobacterium stanieri (strain ATCC 29140 / PCC 7202) TaxID=292563 RepID=K9YR53_CYASC|nr:Conserved TM helix repeat-containing protein [Cyanobacterium stanieri PCC 7202]